MAISKAGGSRAWVSPTPIDPDEFRGLSNSAGMARFDLINDWVEIEEIEDFGEHGDTAEEITFDVASGSHGRVRKLKGSRNAGTKPLVVGRDPLDDGQVALDECERTDFAYPFKFQHNDARSAGYTNSVEYMVGYVLSRPTNMGAANNVVRKTYNISIATAIFEKPSELVGS